MPTLLAEPRTIEFDTNHEFIAQAATELQDIITAHMWGSTPERQDTLTMKVPGPGGGNPCWIATLVHQETYDALKAWMFKNLDLTEEDWQELYDNA